MRQYIRWLKILVLSAGMQQATAQVTLAPAVNYTVSHIASVIAADINGDGKVDLICPNNASPGAVTILTNNGSGGFVQASSPSVGNYPVVCSVVDINNNGRLDLVTANAFGSFPSFNGNTLTVLTNRGGGIFTSNATYAVGSGPISVVTADVNSDGRMDLICANYSNGTLTVLTNNGIGGFGFSATYPVGNYPSCVIAADINGDGKLDLIAANSSSQGNTLTVLTNNGIGIFSSNATYTVGAGPFGITAADVNGDGKPDLISANFGTGNNGTLTVLTNNGYGGFVFSSSPSVGNMPYWVTAADINGDGKTDLISANTGNGTSPNGTLSVLTNDGSGGFVLAASPSVGGNPYGIADDGTNKSLIIKPPTGNLFFRLLHP